ncbi:MAG: hypothetical protein ABI831_05310 [Betaproteobacteria bacterium]
MQARPNKTLLRAILRAFVPAADGLGGSVELHVLRNDTKSPDDDFIRPEVGASLQAYTSSAPSIPPGSEVNVELKFLGGPRGGRPIIQAISKVR